MKKNKKEASLTVEAALVLPIFLFGVLFFLSFFQILFLQDCIQSGMTETGKFFSRYGYLLQEEEVGLAKQIILKERFLEYVEEESISNSYIVGGIHGISFLDSKIMEENNEIEIIANYFVKISVPFFGEKYHLISQKVHTRAFVGQEMKKYQNKDITITKGEELKEDTIVYVTDSGSVYHRSEECTHLKLSITNILKEQLVSARNENGGKYKACEKCVKKGIEKDFYYITKDGDRYHNSLSCSGLKRTIYSVYYFEVKDKRKCSRCG